MGNGARYRKVDLHVHTPASACFTDKSVRAKDIVQAALDSGMDAIAITDHNNAKWVDRVKQAAQGTTLTVFPGVEISVQPGVHVIALFPLEARGEHINALLSKFDIDVDERGNPEAIVTDFGVQKVISLIHGQNAFAILAHIDDHKGAWKELSGQTRVQMWQNAPYDAVEIVAESLPTYVCQDPNFRKPAYYWSSDNPDPNDPSKHSYHGIGTRYSYFKMDDPISWEGLRQCFEDPDVRIRIGDLNTTKKPTLNTIEITGGFLDGIKLSLNQDLNCIIGGRGTGKSALLEIIRHTFNAPVKTEVNHKQSANLLEGVFPAGAMATIGVSLEDVNYKIRRISGREPQVFLLQNNEEVKLDVNPHDLFPIDVYGQKEVYQISLDPEFQLRLLDAFVKDEIGKLEIDEREILQKCKQIADDIIIIEEKISSEQDMVSQLPAVDEKIRRMENVGYQETVKEKQLYDQEKRIIEKADSQVENVVNALDEFASSLKIDLETFPDDKVDGLPNYQFLKAIKASLTRINEKLEEHLDSIKTHITEEWAGNSKEKHEWEKSYQKKEVQYNKLINEMSTEGDISTDLFIQLQDQRSELLEIKDQLEKDKKRRDKLYSERENFIKKLHEARDKEYQIRKEKAKQLSGAMKKVKVEIKPQGNREVYKEFLYDLFHGFNVYKSELDKIAEAFNPEENSHYKTYRNTQCLSKAIRTEKIRQDEDESILEKVFGCNSDAMKRNISSLPIEKLYELEEFHIPDLPIISLKVDDQSSRYRPLDKLSVGQRCTALLSIILLESTNPLLIDQPEDDLDNQFIFDQIVESLRNEREKRQFIIATHNANIPVSGNADLIMVLKAGIPEGQAAENGRVAEGGLGSLDVDSVKEYVTNILEGGSNAFLIRRNRYGRLVNYQ
jgi:ABC-type lipoprotein export system ATPase subunit